MTRAEAVRLYIATCLLAAAPVLELAAQAPVFGNQMAVNRYSDRSTVIYEVDFESGLEGLVPITGAAGLTTAPGEVLEGAQSLRIEPNAGVRVHPEGNELEAGTTYILEYRYRILTGAMPERCAVSVNLGSPLTTVPLGGVIRPDSLDGTDTRSIRVTEDGAFFDVYSCDAPVSIDSIRVLRQRVEVHAGELPTLPFAFPRLGNYQLITPDGIAQINQVPEAQVEEITSRYDLLFGTSIDSTMGAAGWVRRLKQRNANLQILPYKQSFMAQQDPPWHDIYIGLNVAFNRGLAPEWFMRKPSEEALAEPDFPLNVQLDHTRFSPAVGGLTANQYTTEYLARSVLPSGLWAGIHFDQPEWYINPLLGEPPPAIDLDRDGQAEPVGIVQHEWARGFVDFFTGMHKRFGFGQLLYGNAGYIPGNPSILPMLNGWQMEVVSPYRITAGGDWVTDEASSWYRLLGNYRLATEYARAPQIVSLQFTGRDLGEPTGGTTPNHYPARRLALEWRDYQRMRLGLTTALLGNGFFEYDLVDNTTPPLWFDEYAVDASGVATGDARGKGYLGQPLGPGVELDYIGREIFRLDFEGGPAPENVLVGPGTVSSNAAHVIGGTASMVVRQDDVAEGKWLFFADGLFTRGRTYQLFMDYRLLEYRPTTFRGLVGMGFSDPSGELTQTRSASLYFPDSGAPGQQGTLRASVRVTHDGVKVFGGLPDTGEIAIDNVRLIEGTGGVWRRDFERGIVLVNPTPEPQYVPQNWIAGPLQRTGIRRISGSQMPLINNGADVTQGIWLMPADGIILLASTRTASLLTAPSSPGALATQSGAVVWWQPSTGPVSGYHLRYGESPSDLTRHAATGSWSALMLDDLRPGATYFIEVTAVDFIGTRGPSAPLISVTIPGAAEIRPQFMISPATPSVAPGAFVRLEGSNLADQTLTQPGPLFGTTLGSTSVQVNGIDAAIMSVSANTIDLIAPWQIGGTKAVINVTRGGIPGAERLVPATAARPWILTWPSGEDVIALHANGMAVTAHTPARAGDVIVVLAIGLGAVAGPPSAGGTLAKSANTIHVPRATIGGQLAEVRASWLPSGSTALCYVQMVVPALPPGAATMQLDVEGTPSNGVRVFVQ